MIEQHARSWRRAGLTLFLVLATVTGWSSASAGASSVHSSLRSGRSGASPTDWSPLYCLTVGCMSTGRASRAALAQPTATAPAPETFTQSNLAVLAGSKVSLHWSVASGQDFLLTSPGPRTLPNFGSSSVVTWPAGADATWSGAWQWWGTTAGAVSLAVPSTAAPGASYAIDLLTCTTAGPCASSSAQVTLTVAANWSAASYRQDFRTVTTMPQSVGSPLDVAFSGSTIWNSSEFSDAIGMSSAGAGVTSTSDPVDAATAPFAQCFSTPCQPASRSELGERVIIAGRKVWFTQGGWQGFPGGAVANHSEVVAFDPTTRAFCTYIVPGDDNEVIGLASTGTGRSTVIWFVESDPVGGHPVLASFVPASVGQNCPNTYSLGAATGFRTINWPRDDLPALVATDPGGTALWVSDFFGSAVEEVNTTTGAITTYGFASLNAYSTHGAEPWQLVADAGYVYAINYGDDTLIRINKATGRIDQSSIPVTTDTEEGYGLFLVNGRLYFSLADDPRPAFGAATTIGYIDVSGWEAASASCASGVDCAPEPTRGVVYTGLDAVTDPGAPGDLRGIAVGSRGRVAIADVHQVVSLTH